MYIYIKHYISYKSAKRFPKVSDCTILLTTGNIREFQLLYSVANIYYYKTFQF